MTEMATTYRQGLDGSREKLASSLETSANAHALITQQQVLFNTAAAVALSPALSPATTHGWSDTLHAMATAFSRWFANAAQPPRPVYPKRRPWLEGPLLSREMDRL